MKIGTQIMVMKTISWQSTDSEKSNYEYWFKKNWYYHAYCAALYRFIIPIGSRVLQVNCKTGKLLASVQPSYGVGIDTDQESLAYATERYPALKFLCGDVTTLDEQPFDYIIVSSAIMEVDDVQDLLTSLHKFCHPRTRIIIDSYSSLWEPILWLAQKLKLRRPTALKNWVNPRDLFTFLYLADFEIIRSDRHMLIPMYIPLISWFFNTLVAPIPLINSLCLMNYFIARPRPKSANFYQNTKSLYSVSVIVPCKNERGNIQPIVEHCPMMGTQMEIIFVEGGSHDGTFQEMERVAQLYGTQQKKILCYRQPGKGKGDGMRTGFAAASGDVLMILDGDWTVPAEELPKFFDALVSGKGNFINGSRLVYGMEDGAMRFLNLCANYLFGIGFSWLLGQPIKDTLCGTKVLFKKDYTLIDRNRSFFGDFDPFGDFDLLFGAAKQNLKIIEVPVHYKNRSYGTTQISRFKHGLLLLYMCWIAFRRFKCFSLK
jgi:hypothetical protein